MSYAGNTIRSAATSIALLAVPVEAAELLMLDEAGCPWCETWLEEIGPVYPKTDEGRIAPLRRHDIHRPLPEGIELAMRAAYTPTFVLLHEGREVGRIEGYPGEDFFWGLLARLIDRLPEEARDPDR